MLVSRFFAVSSTRLLSIDSLQQVPCHGGTCSPWISVVSTENTVVYHHGSVVDNKTSKNQLFLEEVNGQSVILHNITYTKRIAKMASSTDDFSAEDARILFKLATWISRRLVSI